MNPKYRSGLFIAITFAVMAPYMAFVLYCSFHFPQEQWPRWAVNSIAIWFAANFLIVTLLAQKIFRKPKMVTEIQAKETATTIRQQRPKLARFRWLWFVLAILAILDTPSATIDAVHLAQTDHRLILPAILAFTIRVGWICVFLWIWWKYRPTTQP